MTINTQARYLGLPLESPVVVGACSLTLKPEMVRELSLAGAGAVVLPSLFQEQIDNCTRDEITRTALLKKLGRADTFYDAEESYNGGPGLYLETIRLTKSVVGVPIIASLNGFSGGEWLRFAQDVQQAGCDAIELSLDCELADPSLSSDQVEEQLLENVTQVCDLVSVPVAVKLTRFHSNLANLSWRLVEAGASGIVCFAHEPTWHISTEAVGATLNWSLTPASHINATIAGLVRVRALGPAVSVAASGGISTPSDLIKTMVAGADVGMVTSEVYRSGPDAISQLLEGLRCYLTRHGYTSFEEFSSSRPKPCRSIRTLELGSLTRCREFVDPTPSVNHISGDRWGHVHQ